MWPGVEPERNAYNETYLNVVEDIINEAGRYGIYTLVDMHQDCLSEYFCGEGIPHWAVNLNHENTSWPFSLLYEKYLDKFPEPVMKSFRESEKDTQMHGFPTKSQCKALLDKLDFGSMQTGYVTEAHGAAVENLYRNTDGLLDQWGKFWGVLAKRFKNNKHVLGFELINEPMMANFFGPQVLNGLLPWLGDRNHLQRVYDHLAGYIRAYDTDRLIFFAPATWWSLPGSVFPSFGIRKIQKLQRYDGFTHAPGGAEYANRSVLVYHYYIERMSTFGYTTQYVRPNAERLGTGMFLTETSRFSNTTPDHDKWAGIEQSGYGASWSWWMWKQFCRETRGSMAENHQKAEFGGCTTGVEGSVFAPTRYWMPSPTRMEIDYSGLAKVTRMYVAAAQGTLITSLFSLRGQTNSFSFTLAVDPHIQAPTEVYIGSMLEVNRTINEVILPAAKKFSNRVGHRHTQDELKGVQVTVNPGNALRFEQRADKLYFYAEPQVEPSTHVDVVVTRSIVSESQAQMPDEEGSADDVLYA
jgi:hypothetical protein